VFGSPVWSHDGKFLLQVIQDSKGIRSLYRVDLKTGEFKQIAGNVGDEVVALSSYDETIYMTHPPERGTCPSQSITAIDLSSGRQREIVSLPMRRARFSDGRAPVILSFDEKTLYAGVCGEGIVSVDLATGVQKQILSSQDAVRERGIDLSLSPDERTLAFIVWNADGSRLYRIGVAGTGYRKLADMNSNARMSWSGDGTILLLEQEKPEPINIPRNGNDPEVRSVQGCVNGCSPDGLRVVKRRDPYLELWALDNEWRASCRT
jgi:Tol biopolymer transport system component